MSKLAVRAEIIKLSRLYGIDATQLEYLASVPVEDLRRLREAVQEKLFSDDPTLYKRLSAASLLLPLSLIAMMAEKIFGPALGARVAGEMNYKRAVDLAGKLPISFLADISLELDPARARDIIRNLSPDTVRAVTAELLTRREFVTMGRFVDYLPEASIRKAIEAFQDPADLLHVGFFIENKTQLNQLIRLLPDSLLNKVILAAQAPGQNLWPEAVALMAFVDDPLKRKLGDMAANQDASALAGLAETAHTQQLWDDVLPVVACMSEDSHRKLIHIPLLSNREVMTGILLNADANGLWPAFLPLVRLMPEPQVQQIAEIVTTRFPTEGLSNIVAAASQSGMMNELLKIVSKMPPDRQGALGGAADDSGMGNLLNMARKLGGNAADLSAALPTSVPPVSRTLATVPTTHAVAVTAPVVVATAAGSRLQRASRGAVQQVRGLFGGGLRDTIAQQAAALAALQEQLQQAQAQIQTLEAEKRQLASQLESVRTGAKEPRRLKAAASANGTARLSLGQRLARFIASPANSDPEAAPVVAGIATKTSTIPTQTSQPAPVKRTEPARSVTTADPKSQGMSLVWIVVLGIVAVLIGAVGGVLLAYMS